MEGKWLRRPSSSGCSVIFLHGILSSGAACWQHENGTYWPDLLVHDTQADPPGVYVFTYKTGLFSGTYRLGDVVDALKELLRLDGVVDESRLVFVCHSMGGIVARKYIVEHASELIERRTSISLFSIASPSLGSDYANWLAPIARLFGHTQADALRFSQTNGWLLDLDKDFRNLKEGGCLDLSGKELVEDQFIVLKSFLRKQVVEPFSGARYFGEPFKVPNSDHFSIAKVDGNGAIQHRLLLQFLRNVSSGNRPSEIKGHPSPTAQPTEEKVVALGRFKARIRLEKMGNLLKYSIHGDRALSFSEVLDLLEHDEEFIDFFIFLMKNNGLQGYVWEMPPVTTANAGQAFEFVTHGLPRASGHSDIQTYASYFDMDPATDGVVDFPNLGGDALLVVPSPRGKAPNYSGMAEFLQSSPPSQQRSLWREVARQTKARLSEHPTWLSIAGGGIAWLHVRLDSYPKYYRHEPYRQCLG